MLLAQVVMNAAVVLVRLLSPGDAAAVGALLAAFILARVPLFVFASVQAALLPGLAGAIAAGDQARFRQLIARGCGAVTILGVAGGLPVTIGGPWLIQVLFAARPVLGHADFGWLASGTLFYMLAMVLGQGAMALSRHRALLLSWLAGVLVLALVTITPGDVITRVVIAYAAGSLTAACTLAVVLAQRTASGGGTGSVREYRSTMASSMLSPIAAPASARLPARFPRYTRGHDDAADHQPAEHDERRQRDRPGRQRDDRVVHDDGERDGPDGRDDEVLAPAELVTVFPPVVNEQADVGHDVDEGQREGEPGAGHVVDVRDADDERQHQAEQRC